nr:T9SS type A sorting domain-containing protein [Bacteroidota bacterium]
MKYSIFRLIVLLWLGTSTVFGQGTFFKVYSTMKHEWICECIQTLDNNFIIVGKRGPNSSFAESSALAMRIDDIGNLLNELIIENENNTRFTIVDRMPADEENILLIGAKDSITKDGTNSSLSICMVDQELNILTLNYLHILNNHVIDPYKNAIVDDSTICIVMQDWDLSLNPTVCQFIVSEIKLPGDSISSFFSYPEYLIHIAQDIIFLPQINEFRVLYIGNTIQKEIYAKIVHLDRKLTFDTTKLSPPNTVSSVCATEFTDSTYLYTSTCTSYEPYNPNRLIQMYELNFDSDSIRSTCFDTHPDTNLYAGGGTNTIVNGSTIFTSGMYNVIPLEYPWQDSPTWIQITLLDFDFNIQSQYFYGGDAMYVPLDMTSTNDGGVLVTGIMWDYNQPNNQQHDVFALKLNSDGMIVNIPDNATWQAGEAILYPNPAGSYVNIDFSMEYRIATLQLTDISGKMIFEKNLLSNRQSVDISGVPAGTYVYRIFNEDGLDERGKVVVCQ